LEGDEVERRLSQDDGEELAASLLSKSEIENYMVASPVGSGDGIDHTPIRPVRAALASYESKAIGNSAAYESKWGDEREQKRTGRFAVSVGAAVAGNSGVFSGVTGSSVGASIVPARIRLHVGSSGHNGGNVPPSSTPPI
jgi:hypothetical protein